MKKILILFIFTLLAGCSTKSELDRIIEKNADLKVFVDSLKTTSLTYKQCKECKLSGLDGKKIIGFTNDIHPKAIMTKKKLK